MKLTLFQYKTLIRELGLHFSPFIIDKNNIIEVNEIRIISEKILKKIKAVEFDNKPKKKYKINVSERDVELLVLTLQDRDTTEAKSLMLDIYQIHSNNIDGLLIKYQSSFHINSIVI